MEKCERETIILINQADLEEGFIRFYTTEVDDFRRLMRAVGNLLAPDSISKRSMKLGGFTYEVRVPRDCYRPKTFGLGKPSLSRGKPFPGKRFIRKKKEPTP